MSRPKRAASALGELLSNDPAGSAFVAKAQRLGALQEILHRQLPPELALACRVVNIRGEAVVVHVANNAIAAKLTVLRPRLLRGFITVFADVREVRVEVQTRVAATGGVSPTIRHRVAPPSEAFSALAEKLPPSALRDAVARLARHRRGSD